MPSPFISNAKRLNRNDNVHRKCTRIRETRKKWVGGNGQQNERRKNEPTKQYKTYAIHQLMKLPYSSPGLESREKSIGSSSRSADAPDPLDKVPSDTPLPLRAGNSCATALGPAHQRTRAARTHGNTQNTSHKYTVHLA